MAIGSFFLAGFIGTIFVKLLDFLLELFTKKFAIAAALIAVFAAIYGAAVVSLNGMISSLGYMNVPAVLTNGFSMLPSNTDDCIGLILSAHTVRAAYRFKYVAVQLRAAA